MDTTAAIDNTTKLTTNPVVSTTSTTDSTTKNSDNVTTTKSSGATFESFLQASFGSKTAGNVSEEELFSVLVGQRIDALKGTEASTKYNTALGDSKKFLAKGDGFIPLEDAAKNALASIRDAGTLTKEEADQVYSEAFAGAQLDTNKEALYDDRGGVNDPTMAVAEMSAAIASSKSVIDSISAGTVTASLRALDEASNTKTGAISATSIIGTMSSTSAGGQVFTPDGTTFDADGGFLFKPISVNQGTLAVLLPNAYKGLVSGVTVNDATGNVLDSGTSTGYGDEGEREKFSFSKPGGDYGDNLTVNVQFMDGTHAQYLIPDGSKRYD
jgi:hypothetical protein